MLLTYAARELLPNAPQGRAGGGHGYRIQMMRVGKRLLVGFFWLALMAPAVVSPAAARVEARILIDYDTGAVLDASNPDRTVVPASLTKMMTLYLTFRALEAGDLRLTTNLPISSRAAAMPPTKLGLQPGKTIAVEDAILGLVTRSANDAATVLAEALGGSESGFAQIMTRSARQMGMTKTVFRNASGLPDSTQRTTVRDLARLATRLIADYPEYYRYFSRPSFSYRGRVHVNHNRLLASYRGMDGLKTGFTRASGFNLAASAVRNDRRLIAVVVGGATSRARDAKMVALLDKGFSLIRRQQPDTQMVVASRPPQPAITTAKPSPDDGEVVLASLDTDSTTIPVAIPIARPKLVEIEADDSRPTRPGKTIKRVARTKAASKKKLGNPYGVQVGAFQKSKQARQALQLALRRAPDLLRGTIVSVASLQTSRNRTLFRATLVGLSKADADAACKQLKKKRQDCLVVQAGAVEVAAR